MIEVIIISNEKLIFKGECEEKEMKYHIQDNERAIIKIYRSMNLDKSEIGLNCDIQFITEKGLITASSAVYYNSKKNYEEFVCFVTDFKQRYFL